MQNWVKQLFSSTDRLLDILNVGRLIFYTAAGLLALFPVSMTMHLLVQEESPTFVQSFANAAKAIEFSWLYFFACVVAGFLIAKVGFNLIVAPVFATVSAKLQHYEPREYNFNYRFAQLRNESGEDYQAWLMSEYFRYVEIATFLPLGGAIGLFFFGVFSATFMIRGTFSADSLFQLFPAMAAFLVTAVLLSALVYYVWPFYWKRKILTPTVETYVRAKIALIRGVEDFKPGHSSEEIAGDEEISEEDDDD